MEIVDLSEPFAADNDFGDNDFDDSQADNGWGDQSFLHQRKGKKAKAAKPKQPKIESHAGWEVASEADDGVDFAPAEMDVLLDDLGVDDELPSAAEATKELGTFAKKLESLNRKIPGSALKTAAQVTAVLTPSGIPVDRFEAGDMVVHPSYGVGTITSVDGRGIRRMARVVFLEGESKSFQLSKALLSFKG